MVKKGALNEEAFTSSENDRVKVLELRSKSKLSKVGLVPSIKKVATCSALDDGIDIDGKPLVSTTAPSSIAINVFCSERAIPLSALRIL